MNKRSVIGLMLIIATVIFIVWQYKPTTNAHNSTSTKQTSQTESKRSLKIPVTLKEKVESLEIVVNSAPYQVVSFALYGTSKRYTKGALINAELVKTIYPGWTIRFYHDNTVPKEILKQLLDMGSELVNVEKFGLSKDLGGMFWRFLVVLDPKVDRFIVRDVDSRLNAREAAAVKEWMASDFPIHSMRDHPNHNFPLNGGMWGAVKGAIPNFLEKVEKWRGKTEYLADMDFLGTFWPEIKDKTLSHDAYHCKNYPNCKDFPTPRVGDDHVGLVPGWE